MVVENVASRLSLSHSNNMGGNRVVFYVKHLLFFSLCMILSFLFSSFG